MKFFLILTTIFLTSSFAFINEHYQVLTKEDFDMAHEDNKTSAISWPQSDGSFVESFNKWQCYSTDQIKLSTVEIEDHESKCVPSIEIAHDNFVQLFDIDNEENWDCEKILDDWNELIKNQRSICLFGAFVQYETSNIFLWDLEKIKTENGYWDRVEEAELIQGKGEYNDDTNSF